MPTTILTFTSASVTLEGTLIQPSAPTQAMGDRPPPTGAVLLISGSGQIDRDSNMKRLRIGVMHHIATDLHGIGLTSFRYDKRGVGASSGDYHAAGFRDNVADAASAVEMLRARPDLDADQIFVVGHSEGAIIATELAAADERLAGVVLLAGTASTGEEVLRWQAIRIGSTLSRPVKALLRLFRQDIVRTQTKRLAKLKATTTDTTRIQLVKINAKWFREFLGHDPAPSLRSVHLPVLALTGSKDLQVDPDDVDEICRLVSSECTAHRVENVTHLLRHDAGPPSVRTYKKQATQPLDAGVLDTMNRWLSTRLPAPAFERDPMMGYDDDAVCLDGDGITIKSSLAPGQARHISYAAVRSAILFEPGRFSGRHRLVGIGFRRPRHFFHWDRARSAKTHAIALDTGDFFRTVISPTDHERVLAVLENQGVATSRT